MRVSKSGGGGGSKSGGGAWGGSLVLGWDRGEFSEWVPNWGEEDSKVPDLGYRMSPLFQDVLGESHLRGAQHRRGLGVPGLKGTLGIPIFW